MGREARVGLAVVGVLVGIFSGLLIRKVFLSNTVATPLSEAPAASAQLSPVPQDDKPTVVTAQRDEVGQSHGTAAPGGWTRNGRGEAGAESPDMPRGSYMPTDAPAAEPAVEPRYAAEAEPQDAGASAGEAPAQANPFGGGLAADDTPADPPAAAETAPNQLDVAPKGAAALDARKPPARSTRNPLRRLSAEVPIEEGPSTDDFSTEGAPDASSEPTSDDGAALQPQVDQQPTGLEPAEPSPAADTLSESFDTPIPDPATVEPEAVAGPSDQQPPPGSRYAQPPAEPTPLAAPVEPSRPADGRYTIQPNDSLWTISEKVYGNGRYFKAIHEHNRAKIPAPDRLTAGAVIDVPPAGILEERYPSLCPKQRRSAVVKSRTLQASAPPPAAGGDAYIVAEGDTLFDIARYELGKASRWGEIYELNREVLGEDFDYLQPGLELRMPPRTQTGNAATSDPESRYLR